MPADLEKLYMETITGQRRGVGPAALRVALAAAELPYAGIMRLRNAMFDRGVKQAIDLRRWTISVGNLTAGGTGKTPVVRWLAQRLLAEHIAPAVLTRGYAGSAGRSDEADLLARAIEPGGVVEVNADRAAGADRVLAEHPQVKLFILDDGFQHRRARRDFDLVLINAADPFGHGHVHPRGLLREPISGLNRATAVLITHASRGGASLDTTLATIRRANAAVPIYQCDHELSGLRSVTCPLHEPPDTPLSMLVTQKFYATAGIGHPQSLQSQLERYPGWFVGHAWWPDHHEYSEEEVTAMISIAAERGATAIVTTEKDWSKLVWLDAVRESPVPFYRVDVGLAFAGDDEQRLYDAIVASYRAS